jgi:two-component system, LuxR family, response regulator FixJ
MGRAQVVHILDDDVGVCRSLERLLMSAGYAVESHRSPVELLQNPQARGCLLLDLRMPELDGLEVQAQLNARGSCLPIIIMSGIGSVASAVRAMKSGAVDVLEKPFSEDSLIDAIETAFRLDSRPVAEKEALAACERLAALSKREREVLDQLVAGHPHKVIAADLGISVRTVEVHRARMLRRLGVRTAAEAIRLAVIASLLPSAPLPR